MTQPENSLQDRLGRPLRDLRISVTDRCNFRCVYCMPRTVFGAGFRFLPRRELLTFEEIARVARVAVRLGVRKIRLTGGEPLLRSNLEELVALLAALPGLEDLALTTNGSLLTPARARALYAAGLRRVNISLDALDDATFATVNGVGYPVRRVLAAVEAADAAGLRPVKINMVVKRGLTDQAVEAMAARFRHTPHILRFIEFMDVGTANGWDPAGVVPSQEILERIHRRWPLEPVAGPRLGMVAARYRYRDGAGEIGFISSVSQPFCSGCTRLRLSPEGRLYTCLFGSAGTDLRTPLRSGADDTALTSLLSGVWRDRTDRYSEERAAAPRRERVEMFRIGG
ncbi:GTP 3',8-cyclase [Candidatus Hydrogenisulfobacillus filiaventi]|uniref:GTP 3',8-cyclase n=1 Tax=Candidatus Hydrogenisulfobacillus filiaventi TaxID=2707344 RepID=A0A6F8ZHE8_9FIRM|nr:GTP 3',8-cyclase [Candidatus Hydrogenisulfobacillus filiaventi]